MQSLRPGEVATSLADGLYAKNMLSMSNVLTAIPFASLDPIIAELRPMLAGEGHTARELEFLDRMLDARTNVGRGDAACRPPARLPEGRGLRQRRCGIAPGSPHRDRRVRAAP